MLPRNLSPTLNVLRRSATTPAVRTLVSAARLTKAELPALPYAMEALQPVISKDIMELHHGKHHAAYVTNYNAALDKYAALEEKGDTAGMIALHPALRFNGGGHINHSIFWKNLAPPGKGGKPEGELLNALNARWGSVQGFKQDLTNRAAGVQGSGWVWLSWDPSAKQCTLVTCANQDPCSTTGTVPLFGIDLWEHSYYLQYKNLRPKYVETVLAECVNWNDVAQRLDAAKRA